MVCEQGGISGLHIVGRTFVGLEMQVKPDGYSVINIFEGSFTEEGKLAGMASFEGGFKFAASESRKKFDRIYSVVHRQEEWSASPSTQKY